MKCWNLKWFTGNRNWPRYVYTNYLNQICIGPTKKCLLDCSRFLCCLFGVSVLLVRGFRVFYSMLVSFWFGASMLFAWSFCVVCSGLLWFLSMVFVVFIPGFNVIYSAASVFVGFCVICLKRLYYFFEGFCVVCLWVVVLFVCGLLCYLFESSVLFLWGLLRCLFVGCCAVCLDASVWRIKL